MLARARSFTIEGLRTRPVAVEVDIRAGLPAFAIVGLADAAVREARDRVRAAIQNCGYAFPQQRITANLAPADVPKVGPGFDLALACAVLAASGQIPGERLATHALFGELALDGELRGCDGTLAVALATRAAGLRTLVLGAPRAREACLVEGLDVAVAHGLRSAVAVLAGKPGDALPAPRTRNAGGRGGTRRDTQPEHELADVRRQPDAVRALIVAAAGAHNLLLSGPPGTGKTMLAQRLPSILPPLTHTEALEVTRIHSIAGRLPGDELITRRPFRSPHHSTTTVGLVGGARGWVGEIVLAHHGVLFLDELSEFARTSLEALRQPLEDGRIAVVRAGHSAVYPARFTLVAATNPCPCGYAGEERCACSAREIARHARHLSGPMLDRIDLLVHVARPRRACAREGQASSEPQLTSSRQARAQVLAARERQARRLAGERVQTNGQLDARTLRRHVALERTGEELLAELERRGALSARGMHRMLRVARTLADLDASRHTTRAHVAEALAWRPDTTRLCARRGA